MSSSPACDELFTWQSPAEAEIRLPSFTTVSLIRTALATAPERADLKLYLIRMLFNCRSLTAVIEQTIPALAEERSDPRLLCYLGRAALALGDTPLALRALCMAVERGCNDACGHLAEALHISCQVDEALSMGIEQLVRSPEDSKSFSVVASILAEKKQTSELWALCVDLQERGAWRSYIPSGLAYAATTQKQRREVAALIDWDSWLSEKSIGVSATFNRSLAAELMATRSIGPLPPTQATVGQGTRIEQLNRDGGPLVRELLALIRRAVEIYVQERRNYVNHPMITHAPARVSMEAWAIATHNDGHEAWHVHPDGWISGVYYVEIPELPTRSKTPFEWVPGSIEFGPFPFGPFLQGRWIEHRIVQPQAGKLLLFPSYFGHRTWPTGVDEERVCVAFDVIPSRIPATPCQAEKSYAVGLDLDVEGSFPQPATDSPLPMEPWTFISRNPSIVMAETDDLVSLMSVDRVRFYTLNDSGSDLWRRLEVPRTFATLVEQLSTAFNVDRAAIEEDIRELLMQMRHLELVLFDPP